MMNASCAVCPVIITVQRNGLQKEGGAFELELFQLLSCFDALKIGTLIRPPAALFTEIPVSI